MSQNKYHLPAPLDFLDKYSKTILTTVVSLLFTASLIGYVYLSFFSKSPDLTEPIIKDAEYEAIAIHQAIVRPGQTGNSLTVKIIPTSNLTSTTLITVSVTELNPAYVVLYQEREKSFDIPSNQAQMQILYDVVNAAGLPNKLEFRVTVKRDQINPVSGMFSIDVSKISAEQFTLISAIVTGAISLWLIFGQELIKFRMSNKK